MIFVSFGNSPVPFIRMAEAVDKYASESGEKIIVQSGQTKYHFKHCEAVPFMDKNVFRSHLESCEIAILQGGWGSISEASDMGVRIIAIPRINGVEHYHDQVQLVKALENEKILIGCYDITMLPQLVETAKVYEFCPIVRGDASKIINEFLNLIS